MPPDFTMQGLPFRAIGPTVLEDQILPILQDRRRALPVDRVLEDHYVMTLKQPLFVLHVDVEVRIGLVKVVNGDPFEPLRLDNQPPVDV